jgi:glucose/arabinose dehydrogenase
MRDREHLDHSRRRRFGGGRTAKAGMEQPVYFWNSDIAPSGLLFYSGSRFADWSGDLFLGGLLGKRLIRLRIRQDRVVFEEPLLTELKAHPRRAARSRWVDLRVDRRG